MKRLILAAIFTACAACAQTATLVCGQPQNSSFSSDAPVKTFRYTGDAGEAIALRVITNPTNLVVMPELRSPSNTAVTPRNSPTLQVDIIEYDLAAAGDYQLNLRGSAAGTFQILLIRLNRPCGNTVLACGTPASGKITAPGQIQVFQFDGKAGDQVVFTALRTGGDAQSSLLVAGYDAGGQLQKAGANPFRYAGLPAVRLSYRLTSDGSQVFLVGETSGNLREDFLVSVVRLNGGCSAKTLSCGSVTDGTVTTALGANLYTIPVAAGDLYLLRIRVTDTGGLRAAIEVYDPQGAAVQIGTSSDPSRGTFTATSAGTYALLVRDAGGMQSGAYSMALVRLNGGCNTQALGCGAVVDAKVDGPLRFGVYAVNSQANDAYLLRLARTDNVGSFQPSVEVYGPDGARVQNLVSQDVTSTNFTAPAAGLYTLLAWDGFDGSQTGAYAMSVTRLNRPCDGATPLACGTVSSAAIDRPLRAGVYSYATAAGDAFTVRVIDTAGALQSTLQIWDPQGRSVGPPVSGTIKSLDVVRAAAGAYTVLVTDESRIPRQGAYILQSMSTRGSCGTSPPAGQSVAGLVTGSSPFQSYVIRASGGDMLLLRSAGFTAGIAMNMDLYDPAGNRLESGTFRIARSAPADGAYTVVAGSSAPRSAGSYAFSWQLLNNPPAATPALECGRTVISSLSQDAQFRYYTVGGNAGDLLKLVLTRLPDNLNAQMELYDSTGARVNAGSAEISRQASGGSYLLLVSPATAFAESGAFALAFQRPNNPCGPAGLACGQTILQTVTGPGQLDAYTVSGSAGDRIALRVLPRSGSFSPFLELYGPTGALLPGSGAVSTLGATLSASGTYTVLLRDRSGANTGSYRIGLQRGNNECPEDDSQKPTIRLRRPTGGEVISGGTAFRIIWESDDNVDVTSHSIRLSTDGGKSFPVTIRDGLSGATQSFDWLVPADTAPTRTAVIQVTAADRAGNSQLAVTDLLTLLGSGFRENSSVSYVYDGLNRIVQATYGDGRVVRYTYDASGNLVQVSVQ